MKNFFITLAIATFLIACSSDNDSVDETSVLDVGILYPEIAEPPDSGIVTDLPFSEGPCEGLSEGASCDDGDKCTVDDTCQNGFCVSTNSMDCGSQSSLCQLSYCDPEQGCISSEAADGAVCALPCFEKAQCFSGKCMAESGTDIICPPSSDPCVDSVLCSTETGACTEKMYKLACPDNTVCRAENDTDKLICVPLFETLCRPCNATEECLDPLFPEEVQQCRSYGNAGSFCSADCTNHSCPKGFQCLSDEQSDGTVLKQCVPEAGGTCQCAPKWAPLMYSTSCIIENEFGKCEGKRACTTTGLTECDAGTPAAEVCDNVDNDCNGVVDDGPDNVCGPKGACCIQAGECESAFQDSCLLNGGQFLGVGLTCKEVSCGGGNVGSCCMKDGVCALLTQPDCVVDAGSYQGDGMKCSELDCTAPPEIGACCGVSGNCSVTSFTDCLTQGGLYAGHSTKCDAGLCKPKGACCTPGGQCFELSQEKCLGLDGVFTPNLSCGMVPCLPPDGKGACCMTGGACAVFDAEMCTKEKGTLFLGENCAGQCTVNLAGACCETNGSCTEVKEAACPQSASWQGSGKSCPDACIGKGACCTTTGCIEALTPSQCNAVSGTYLGDKTECAKCPN